MVVVGFDVVLKCEFGGCEGLMIGVVVVVFGEGVWVVVEVVVECVVKVGGDVVVVFVEVDGFYEGVGREVVVGGFGDV